MSKKEYFDTIFPDDCLASIESIQPPSQTRAMIVLLGTLCMMGNFPSKRPIPVYNTKTRVTRRRLGREFGSASCTERNIYFLWNLCHESIMTEVQRKKRGCTNNDLCKRSGEAPESVTHAVRDCRWLGARGSKEMTSFSTKSGRSHISCHCNCNTNNKNSCGGVIRNHNGCWVTGFANNLGNGSNFQAEVWGVLLGLLVAWEKGLQKVIFETDSMMTINVVDKEEDSRSPCRGLI
ncbi:putative ribonuclease H-like domain-containing protein [Senna tora]|uniref:Putative ribonuclease H-like domain-containing protein n=1 Tax=Senna tora TaxID=362788 RepID=A0A834X4N8_9FABA|nr:putative ribonuclease H-like domain-containing protein [Senna tora]